jgi:hypothetical protein
MLYVMYCILNLCIKIFFKRINYLNIFQFFICEEIQNKLLKYFLKTGDEHLKSNKLPKYLSFQF